MSNIWNHRDEQAAASGLVGFDVEASDGHIGKIDESSLDAGRANIVVDTGHWIFGKKRLIPAGVIGRIDRPNGTVHVTMTKEQIKHAPDFDAGWLNDATYADRLNGYFGPHVM